MRGIVETTPHDPVTIDTDYSRYPNYVAVGDLRVIVWDSNNASGNPSAVGSTVPDQRTIDSQNLSPGEFYFYQPPINIVRVVDGMMVNLGFHLEYGLS